MHLEYISQIPTDGGLMLLIANKDRYNSLCCYLLYFVLLLSNCSLVVDPSSAVLGVSLYFPFSYRFIYAIVALPNWSLPSSLHQVKYNQTTFHRGIPRFCPVSPSRHTAKSLENREPSIITLLGQNMNVRDLTMSFKPGLRPVSSTNRQNWTLSKNPSSACKIPTIWWKVSMSSNHPPPRMYTKRPSKISSPVETNSGDHWCNCSSYVKLLHPKLRLSMDQIG